MTTEELIAQFSDLATDMCVKMQAKNNDYAGKRDPLKNLRKHGVYGITIRMDDKLCRLDSFFNPAEAVERKVKDESVDDTLMDLATYALLAIILRRDEERSSAPREAAL